MHFVTPSGCSFFGRTKLGMIGTATSIVGFYILAPVAVVGVALFVGGWVSFKLPSMWLTSCNRRGIHKCSTQAVLVC